MPPVEPLHLEHVLQTVRVLESVVLRSFGPEGGQVLFTRDTGQAMLSRSGTRILTALCLEHPLARMVVDCVLKHSAVTGDGSKTFVLLLASLLRMIHTTACKEPNVCHAYKSREAAQAATARHLADKLLAFASDDLDDLIATGVVPYGCCLSWDDFTALKQDHLKKDSVQQLLVSFFHSRLGRTHCDFISDLICELLTHFRFKDHSPASSLLFIKDNWSALHTPVSGFPIGCSRVLEGQVIHRDFATPCPQSDQQTVKAVVVTGCLQPKLLGAGEVLELGYGERQMEDRSIVQFSAWTERSLECAVAHLQHLGVSVLLCAVKQSGAALAAAAQADMSVVECVSEDELSLFSLLSGARPVSDCRMIEPDHVATLTFCRPILLGAHRYVHVAFHNSEEKLPARPCSLVLCGPAEGQTDQHARAFQDAIRMLLSTWEPMNLSAATASSRTLQPESFQRCVVKPGCVLPAGGTFEFLLHRALLQHGRGGHMIPQILASALLSVPQQIYSHHPQHFLQTRTTLLSCAENHSHPFGPLKPDHNTILPGHNNKKYPPEDGKQSLHCSTEADASSRLLVLDRGLESLSCKYQLLLAVVQCVSTLLHVDTVLRTHTASHAESHRPANISWEGTEDEAED